MTKPTVNNYEINVRALKEIPEFIKKKVKVKRALKKELITYFGILNGKDSYGIRLNNDIRTIWNKEVRIPWLKSIGLDPERSL